MMTVLLGMHYFVTLHIFEISSTEEYRKKQIKN